MIASSDTDAEKVFSIVYNASGGAFTAGQALEYDTTPTADGVRVTTGENLSEMLEETDPTGAPVWDAAAVQKLAQEPKTDEIRRETLHDDLSNEDLDRDEVVVFHIWCRVTRKIYCIGYTPHVRESEGVFLRQPVDYFGHPAGPYVIFGVVWVRGQAYPVSLTALFARNVEEQDEHRKKARDDARAAKKMLAVEGAKLARAIVNKENNGILAVEALSKLQEFEFGGVQQATAEYMAFLDNDWETLTGLSQVRQGNVDADATATAVVEASSAAECAFDRCPSGPAMRPFSHAGYADCASISLS